MPTRARLRYLLIGFLWPIVYFCIYEFVTSELVHNPHRINTNYTWTDFFKTTAYLLRAVAYEELTFRGALLYILISRLGQNKAIWISTLSFGVYHWFAWQAFGSPVQMLIVLLTTGSMGYIFALAFVKTKSLYLPFALHFGGNLINMAVFSKDKTIGLQLLEKTHETDPVVPGILISITVIFIHFVGYQLLTFLILRKNVI